MRVRLNLTDVAEVKAMVEAAKAANPTVMAQADDAVSSVSAQAAVAAAVPLMMLLLCSCIARGQ